MSEVFALTIAHLRLVLVALAVAMTIGVGLGVLASRHSSAGRALLVVTGLVPRVRRTLETAGVYDELT